MQGGRCAAARALQGERGIQAACRLPVNGNAAVRRRWIAKNHIGFESILK
jgi:hypothetical protein